MTVKALLNEIRGLRAEELRLVAAELDRLGGESSRSDSSASNETHAANLATNSTVEWPDRTARRREIFGDAVLPNLVLEERELSRW